MSIIEYANEKGLNGDLASRQGLTEKDVDDLFELHQDKSSLLTAAAVLRPHVKSDLRLLKRFVTIMETIEDGMQEAWKFEKDANYHTHWLSFPQCKCPKMDNKDAMYYGRGKIISSKCPLHREG